SAPRPLALFPHRVQPVRAPTPPTRRTYAVRALVVSRRPGIILSTEKVVVFDQRGTRIVLSWSEVTDIFTESSRAGVWLLAVVPPNSPAMYQSPTAKLYDAKRGALKVCDLRRIGLAQHQVDSALNAIHP
ncbi:hypothetical protein, partial [Streptomyces scabiei]|uniref:hypothetical protein n=1 Tax=Streptomyces scabiei TaxID=1930 RepID=UPI0029B3BB0B